MNEVSAALSMVTGSALLAFFIMVFSLNLAYAARRWLDGIRSMSDI